MKKSLWLLLLSIISVTLSAQRNADYGIFGGVSSYLGDINTSRLLYSPGPAGGLFYRYNFHPRQALRANIFIGGLKADDLDFDNDFQTARKASFSGRVSELAVHFEFNFLPYSTQGRKFNYTPYIAAGAGIVFIDINSIKWDPLTSSYSTDQNFTYTPVIPFSLGLKINIHKNLGLEVEYGLRKTFYDNFDGLEELTDPSQNAWLHNNDWYSFAGVAFTWKMYNRLAGCPAYDKVDGKRRKR